MGALVVALLAAGCGGGDASSGSTTTAPTATTAAGGDAVGIADLDPCDLLTADAAADLARADVTPTTGGNFGRAIGCAYRGDDDTGGGAGAALAQLTLREDEDATAASLQADADDAAEDGDEVADVDLGDGGVSVVTGTRIVVTYVVERVVVEIRVEPTGGVEDDDLDKVLEFGDSIVEPIKDAVGLGSPGPTTATTAGTTTTTAPPTPTTLEAAPVDISSLQGRWQSTYGYCTFFNDGARLIGAYTTDNGSITLRQEEPGVFVGWWTEEPTREPDADAGNLEVRAFLDEDGEVVLRGVWSYGDTPPASGWDFTRTDEEPPPGLEERFDDRSEFDQFVDHP
jgi:hypothetical protein